MARTWWACGQPQICLWLREGKNKQEIVVEFLFPLKCTCARTFPMERNEAILCSKHHFRSQNYRKTDSFTISFKILQSNMPWVPWVAISSYTYIHSLLVLSTVCKLYFVWVWPRSAAAGPHSVRGMHGPTGVLVDSTWQYRRQSLLHLWTADQTAVEKNEKCWVPKANESGAATLFKVSNWTGLWL